VTVGTTGPIGSGLPQLGFPRRFAIARSGSFPGGPEAANALVYHDFRGEEGGYPSPLRVRRIFRINGLQEGSGCKILIPEILSSKYLE
jgi:hypothetical protein